MKPLDRNISVLEHIVSYCQQIEQTVERFGNSAETFQNDPIYRNAAALCILQIGELVGKLTDEFRAQHPAVPWRQIKAMRNIVAHSYGTVDPETTWEIITDDIPALKKYCETIIASQQKTKCPIRVLSAKGTFQNAESDPNGTLFCCAVRVCPNGTPYRYGRTKISPLTLMNCSGTAKHSKQVCACSSVRLSKRSLSAGAAQRKKVPATMS